MTRLVKFLRCPNKKCRGAAMAEVIAQPEGQFLHTFGVERVGHVGAIQTTLAHLASGWLAGYARHAKDRTFHLSESMKHILPESPVFDDDDLESVPTDATWPGKTEQVACRRCHGVYRVTILPGANVVLKF